METLVHRSAAEPVRPVLDWRDTWEGADRGLVQCWETGRKRARSEAELASRCLAGELPPLGWKGGVAKRLKKLEKFGSLKYLAEWQGLRGEDLHIDLAAELTLTCAATGMLVTFTGDLAKLAGTGGDDEGENAES